MKCFVLKKYIKVMNSNPTLQYEEGFYDSSCTLHVIKWLKNEFLQMYLRHMRQFMSTK